MILQNKTAVNTFCKRDSYSPQPVHYRQFFTLFGKSVTGCTQQHHEAKIQRRKEENTKRQFVTAGAHQPSHLMSIQAHPERRR